MAHVLGQMKPTRQRSGRNKAIGTLSLLLLATTSLADVAIVEVDPRAPLHKQGITENSVLVDWVNELAEGTLDSPFHFEYMFVTQAPYLATQVRVKQIGQPTDNSLSFSLKTDDWHLRLRPMLEVDLDPRLKRATELAHRGELEQAAKESRLLLNALQADQPLVRLWVELMMSRQLMRAGEPEAALEWLPLPDDNIFATVEPAWVPVIFARQRAAILGRHPDAAIGEQAWRLAIETAQAWDPDSLIAARVYFDAAGYAIKHRKLEQAAQWHQQARRLRADRARVSLPMAESESALGVVAAISRDVQRSIDAFQAALTIVEQADPTASLRGRLNSNLGVSYSRLGDYRAAQRHYERALAHHEKYDPEQMPHGHAVSNLGNLMRNRGDLAQAETLVLRGLEIRRKADPTSRHVGRSLGTLAAIALDRGNLQQAKRYNEQALAWAERSGDGPASLAYSWSAAGRIALRQQRYQDALAAFEKSIASNDADAAFANEGLSEASLALGRVEQAVAFAQQSITLHEAVSTRNRKVAAAQAVLARAQRAQGKHHDALAALNAGLTLQQELAPGTAIEAVIHHELALTYEALKRVDSAQQHYQAAIDALKAQSRRIGGDETTRALFESDFDQLFKDYLQLQLRLGDHDGAFETIERFRARRLRVLLAQRDIAWELAVPAELLARQDRLTRRYDQVSGALQQAGSDQTALLQSLDQLALERQALSDRIMRTVPELAQAIDPPIISLAELRQSLPAGSALLSYVMLKEQLVIFLLRDQDSLFQQVKLSQDRLTELVTELRRQLASPSVDFEPSAAAELYQVLIKPLTTQLQGAEQLIIVPEGPLQALPFAALFDGSQFLVEKWPSTKVASLTLLDHLVKREHKQQSDQIVAYADPTQHVVASTADTHAVVRGERLDPLPGSRDEVSRLQATFPHAELRVGPAATEASVKGLTGRLPIVHFAVHGVTDSLRPLDSFLAMARPGEDDEENGLLQVWEVFESVRFEADLVTLSACRSGLGLPAGGEGVLGLTRAFQYAGANHVLASLWDISDRSTVQLMGDFYQELANSDDKALSLARAQRNMLQQKPPLVRWWARFRGRTDWSHPYYWAAFEIHGPNV